MEHDVAVMATASDASLCKLSASNLGYFTDEFVQHFVKNPSRRLPIINRGYFARVRAMEVLVERFLVATQGQPRQIVILGAGFDTLFFKLQRTQRQLVHQCEFFELDFEQVTHQKILTMVKTPCFREALGFTDKRAFQQSVNSACNGMHAPGYHLVACDLRDLRGMEQALCQCDNEAHRMDLHKPTLVLSECVLIYMEANFSNALVEWFEHRFDQIHFVLYEQILPNDAFGKVMLANIRARGCDLRSIEDFPTLEAQIERFTSRKFEMVQAKDLNFIYYKFLDENERLAIERLELFDELEEFHMLQAHYCIVVASKKRLEALLLEPQN